MEDKPQDYVEAIQSARERLGWTQSKLSAEMSKGMSWASMVESRQRGIDIDQLPLLAEKLRLDGRSLIRSYLFAKHPDFYRSLFPEENFVPDVHEATPGADAHGMMYRLSRLPQNLRAAIEATILAAYEHFGSS